MITIEQVQTIKRTAEEKRAKIQRTRGSYDQLLKTLETDFQCKTVQEAKEKLEQLKTEGLQLAKRIEKIKSRVSDLWEEIENNSGSSSANKDTEHEDPEEEENV